MATLKTTVQLDAQLHERLMALKMHVSAKLRFSEHSLGLGPMLGLLLDHWEQTTPVPEWLEAQAALYPKRGRPRRSEPVSMEPRVALRKSASKGHDLVFRKGQKSTPWRTYYCKNCNMLWSTWDFKEPPAGCPARDGFSSLYTPKIWKKSDLLLEGFEPDEVGWAADGEQEQVPPV